MKPILIRERLRPFSHRPGVSMVLPGTHDTVRLYPTRIELHPSSGEQKEWDLPLSGPVEKFVATMDLERSEVALMGSCKTGHFRYFLGPDHTLRTCRRKSDGQKCERLSFGSHAHFSLERLEKRLDPREIFPLWHRLSLLTPPVATERNREGMFALLEQSLPLSLIELFKAGCTDLFVPRLRDTQFHGIVPKGDAMGSAFHLIKDGGKKLRAHFFLEEDDKLHLLPARLFSPCGKMTDIETSWGTLSFEWSSFKLRRVQLLAKKTGALLFRFPKELKRFRWSLASKRSSSPLSTDTTVEINSGEIYEGDRFEK